MLADYFDRRVLSRFRRGLWFEYCGVEDPDAQPEELEIGGRKKPKQLDTSVDDRENI